MLINNKINYNEKNISSRMPENNAKVNFAGGASDKFIKFSKITKAGLLSIPILSILGLSATSKNDNFIKKFFRKIGNFFKNLLSKKETKETATSKENIHANSVKEILPNRVAYKNCDEILSSSKTTEEKLQQIKQTLKTEGIKAEQIEQNITSLGTNPEEQLKTFKETLSSINIKDLPLKQLKPKYPSSSGGSYSGRTTTKTTSSHVPRGAFYSEKMPIEITDINKQNQVEKARKRLETYGKIPIASNILIDPDAVHLVEKTTDEDLDGLIQDFKPSTEVALFFQDCQDKLRSVITDKAKRPTTPDEVERMKLLGQLVPAYFYDAEYNNLEDIEHSKSLKQVIPSNDTNTLNWLRKATESLIDELVKNGYTKKRIANIYNTLLNIRFVSFDSKSLAGCNNFDPTCLFAVTNLTDKLKKVDEKPLKLLVTKNEVKVCNDVSEVKAELNNLKNSAFEKELNDLTISKKSTKLNKDINHLFGEGPKFVCNKNEQTTLIQDLFREFKGKSLTDEEKQNIIFLLSKAIITDQSLLSNSNLPQELADAIIRYARDSMLKDGAPFIYSPNRTDIKVGNSMADPNSWMTDLYAIDAADHCPLIDLVQSISKVDSSFLKTYPQLKNIAFYPNVKTYWNNMFPPASGNLNKSPDNLIPCSPLATKPEVDKQTIDLMHEIMWHIVANDTKDLNLDNSAGQLGILQKLAQIKTIDRTRLSKADAKTIAEKLKNTTDKIYEIDKTGQLNDVTPTSQSKKAWIYAPVIPDNKLHSNLNLQASTANHVTTLSQLKNQPLYVNFFNDLNRQLEEKFNDFEDLKLAIKLVNGVVVYDANNLLTNKYDTWLDDFIKSIDITIQNMNATSGINVHSPIALMDFKDRSSNHKYIICSNFDIINVLPPNTVACKLIAAVNATNARKRTPVTITDADQIKFVETWQNQSNSKECKELLGYKK